MVTERFGVLPTPTAFAFKGGRVAPVSEHAELAKGFLDSAHPDGFLYPPLQQTYRSKPGEVFDESTAEIVPNSERPALWFFLPASHELTLDLDPKHADRLRDASFLIHLLAYLNGTRLQFEDWQVDGRVPTKNLADFTIDQKGSENFVDFAYAGWRSWSPEWQKMITNILWMNSRIHAEEWEWRQFLLGYMVFDACYSLAKRMWSLPRCSHSDRFDQLCGRLSLAKDSDAIKEFVRLRNDLFHEALWDQTHPGLWNVSERVYTIRKLLALNSRLIPALLGYMTPYIRTSWSAPFRIRFERP